MKLILMSLDFSSCLDVPFILQEKRTMLSLQNLLRITIGPISKALRNHNYQFLVFHEDFYLHFFLESLGTFKINFLKRDCLLIAVSDLELSIHCFLLIMLNQPCSYYISCLSYQLICYAYESQI
jgi:hypothetical protein